MSSVRAHQHPINAMRLHGDRIVTASSDHTLKVCGLVCADSSFVMMCHGYSVQLCCGLVLTDVPKNNIDFSTFPFANPFSFSLVSKFLFENI